MDAFDTLDRLSVHMARRHRRENRRKRSEAKRQAAMIATPSMLATEQVARDMLIDLSRRTAALRRHVAYDEKIRSTQAQSLALGERIKNRVVAFAEALGQIVVAQARGLDFTSEVGSAETLLRELEELVPEATRVAEEHISRVYERADHGVETVDRQQLDAGAAATRTHLRDLAKKLIAYRQRLDTVAKDDNRG